MTSMATSTPLLFSSDNLNHGMTLDYLVVCHEKSHMFQQSVTYQRKTVFTVGYLIEHLADTESRLIRLH